MKQIFSLLNYCIPKVFGLMIPAILLLSATTADVPPKLRNIAPQDAKQIAIDAYIYGYPLLTSEITRLAFTNTDRPNPETLQAPLNQIVNQPLYPPATYKGVTAPNADTLYTAGFIDVSQEPMVFSYPDMGDRYFLFPFYDQWTEVIDDPGTRTTGGAAQNVLITGPSWTGTSEEMLHLKSPTNNLFIIGRVYSDGTLTDLETVHALQKKFKLVPLSKFGQPYTPPEGSIGGPYTPKQIVRDVLSAMTTAEYFNMLAHAMKMNPPVLPRDGAIVEQMAKLGVFPGRPFDIDRLSPSVQSALEDVGKIAFSKIAAAKESKTKVINGWNIPGVAGRYGSNYLDRAVIAAFGWGANLPDDAVYPFTAVDALGGNLNGKNVYKIHFDKGKTPPVDGFWSITLYDNKFYFYPNALNKLTVSPRDRLKYNEDGSVDLYFSNKQPANVPQSNWLPAPQDDFILMLRMYWPRKKAPSIFPTNNPTWEPPAVREIF